MKKLSLILLLLLILSGCADVATFETLGSIPQQPSTQATQAQVQVQLPQEAMKDTMQGEMETLYTCEDYTITMQTLASGDLNATIMALSGYEKEKLTVMESASGQASRYDWVWSAAGAEGDLVGRASVLDDGSYHYCLCVMASAQKAGELTQEWNELFSSFHLES